jgi:sugar O-acyltransferase (sialic acid O-acetyltransferase NeuD family)
VFGVALACGYEVLAFVGQDREPKSIFGIQVLDNIRSFARDTRVSFVVAVGSNFARERIYAEISGEIENKRFPFLVHPSAAIMPNGRIGKGTVVMANCLVGVETTIGDFCLLNSSASIDHTCKMSDYSSLGPSCVVGGDVEIGVRSALSIGSVIKNSVQVGHDSVIGAASYVYRSIGDNVVAYGTPASVVRSRGYNEPYL